MVSTSKIVKGLTNLSTDAFSHAQIKTPNPYIEREEKLAGEISQKASEAVTNYGKAVVKKRTKLLKTSSDFEEELRILLKKNRKAEKYSTISLEEAVKEFDMLELSETQKADLILACTFQKKSNETIISRPALYMTKYAILNCYGKIPDKLDKAIKTAMYDNGNYFDIEYFYFNLEISIFFFLIK